MNIDDKKTDILLIDDSLTDLRLLMDALRHSELNLSVATNGTEGYNRANLLNPGLLLIDVSMPDIDGFTLCQHLKKNVLTRDIPVIFLTASTDLNERLRGFEVGGVDYICKPFEIQEVIARVGVHLKNTHIIADQTYGSDDHLVSIDARGLKDKSLVNAAQQILLQDMANPPSLEALVSKLFTNRKRLNDAFLSITGQSVFGWFHAKRLSQAHFYLSKTDMSIGMISEIIGYSTSANFTKSFRLHYGFSPSEARKSQQKNTPETSE